MTGFLRVALVGFGVALLAVPLAVVLLHESPDNFALDRWCIVAAGGLIGSLFAKREGTVRGVVAGVMSIITACLALAHSNLLESIGRLGLILILAGNLIGLMRSASMQILAGAALVGLGTFKASWTTGLAVLIISGISWAQAELLTWLGPKLASPLRRAKHGASFILAFGVLVSIVLVLFALLFFMLSIINPRSFSTPSEIHSPLGFEAYVYQSVRVMTTAGPAYEPLTPAARLVVGSELLVSVGILIFYLNLVITHALSFDRRNRDLVRSQ